MVNLTTYRPRTISVGREIPKTARQLIEHERNYREFLRKRIKTTRTLKNERRVSFDLHAENISHFRLRQIRWKNQVERENHRLLCSLISRQLNYRPSFARSVVEKDFQRHLNILKSLSNYSSLNRNKFGASEKVNFHGSTSISNLTETTKNAIPIYRQRLPPLSSVRVNRRTTVQ